MAPEVAMCRPYGKKCDIYSFGIFLWELSSLETPFDGYDIEKHGERVVRNNERPKLYSGWPALVRDVIKGCWSANVDMRPNFDWICSTLRNEINAQDNEIFYRTKLSHERISFKSRRNLR